MRDLEQKFDLKTANWKVVRKVDYKVAVLPWGATEAHNYHLPYGTDNYQVEFVAQGAGSAAAERGTDVLILPCVPFGVNTGQMDVKFCLNILPSTQLQILKDVCDVLIRHGVEKLVLLNGHGGNNFKNMIRELSLLFPDLFVCWVNWYQVVDWNEYFDDPGDHAGEMETSAMLHIRPDLVRPLTEAGSGKAKKIGISGFAEGWVTSQRSWTKVTRDTGVGNPALATAEKGQKYLNDCIDKLATFLIELHETQVSEFYS